MDHLFHAGDNLVGLEIVAELGIEVDLVYIDPPFATNTEFLMDSDRANTVSASGELAYADTLRGDDYLEQLGLRLEAIRRVMAGDGSGLCAHRREDGAPRAAADGRGIRRPKLSQQHHADQVQPQELRPLLLREYQGHHPLLLGFPAQDQVAPAGGASHGRGCGLPIPAGGCRGAPLRHHAAARAGDHEERPHGRDLEGDAAASGEALAAIRRTDWTSWMRLG